MRHTFGIERNQEARSVEHVREVEGATEVKGGRLMNI
jgi:hypothetical protein